MRSALSDPGVLEEPVLPPGFERAHAIVYRALRACERGGVPKETIAAVLLTELMPRLLEVYGPHGGAAVLGRIAGEVAGGSSHPGTRL